jgi:hypothetical protein
MIALALSFTISAYTVSAFTVSQNPLKLTMHRAIRLIVGGKPLTDAI